MAIEFDEKETIVTITVNNFTHYKEKYTIAEVGKRILVNVEDLHEGSTIKVTKICDMEWCNNRTTNQTYNAVMKSRKTTDGKDRCSECGMLYSKNPE